MTVLFDASASSTSTTCQCWVLTRTDGHVLRLSEHDKPLEIDNETYLPGALIQSSRFTLTSDLAPGRAEVEGAIETDAITSHDLSGGIWDGASVDVFRADWRTLERIAHIWSGRLGQVEYDGSSFSAELVSLKADFSRLLGRAYTRQCDAVLGDARCGVDTDRPDIAGKTCDQTFTTCRDTFDNVMNFRGFEHMPGTDFLLAGPAAGRQS